MQPFWRFSWTAHYRSTRFKKRISCCCLETPLLGGTRLLQLKKCTVVVHRLHRLAAQLLANKACQPTQQMPSGRCFICSCYLFQATSPYQFLNTRLFRIVTENACLTVFSRAREAAYLQRYPAVRWHSSEPVNSPSLPHPFPLISQFLTTYARSLATVSRQG